MFELDEPFVGKEELNYLKQAIDRLDKCNGSIC